MVGVAVANIAICSALGGWLVWKGYVDGVKGERIETRAGLHEGAAARRVGWTLVVLGALLPLSAVAAVLLRIFRS